MPDNHCLDPKNDPSKADEHTSEWIRLLGDSAMSFFWLSPGWIYMFAWIGSVKGVLAIQSRHPCVPARHR